MLLWSKRKREPFESRHKNEGKGNTERKQKEFSFLCGEF